MEPEVEAQKSRRRELITTELLEKAAQLFAERGFSGTTIRDIADAMGMTRPALYYYFPNKEAVLQELVAGVTGVGAAELRRLRKRSDITATEKLRYLVRGTAQSIAASPVRFRLLERNESDLPDSILKGHRDSKRQILRELSDILADGVSRGEFRPVDVRTASLAIIGMTNWIAWWYRPGGDQTPESVADQMVNLVCNGMVRHDDRMPAVGVAGAINLIREDLAYLESILEQAPSATDSALPGQPADPATAVVSDSS